MSNNRTTSTRVQWDKSEVEAVVLQAALLTLSGFKYRGFGSLLLEAQKVLAENRHRPATSLQNVGKAHYGEAVSLKIEELLVERKAEKEAKAQAKVEEPKKVPEPEVIEKKVEQPIQPLIQMSMDFFIDNIADAFKKQLRHALNVAAAEVLEEVSKAANVTELVAAATHKEVSAFTATPAGATEVKAPKIRVAILGGNGKGGDQAFITEGLEEVYDFRFIDSEKGIGGRVKGCDLVVVRTPYCSHGLQHSAERVVDKSKIIKITRGSPKAINEVLLSHYAHLNLATHVAAH